MSEKLYYKDAFIREFTANIKDFFRKNSKYHVLLDRTAFYPEGGGQPSDIGTIAGIEVEHVYKEKDNVFHIMELIPEKKVELKCKINWDKRFDHMQQHTGEHIISAIFYNMFNANNIGFHLGEDYVSIDLDIDISEDNINSAEMKANELIYNDYSIETFFPDEKLLKNLSLRKSTSIKNDIRIVKIGDIDITPCGGTHLLSTGQLGIIKIIDFNKYKGGTRIKFLCGKRALKDYHNKNKIIREIRTKLSTNNENILFEIDNLNTDIKNKDEILNTYKNKILLYKKEQLLNSADKIKDIKIISKIFKEIDFSDLRSLAKKLISEDNIVLIFAQSDDSNVRLLLSRSNNINNLDMNNIIKKPLEIIGGRGGGNKITAQGGGNKVENINKVLDYSYKIIKEQLHKIL